MVKALKFEIKKIEFNRITSLILTAIRSSKQFQAKLSFM